MGSPFFFQQRSRYRSRAGSAMRVQCMEARMFEASKSELGASYGIELLVSCLFPRAFLALARELTTIVLLASRATSS